MVEGKVKEDQGHLRVDAKALDRVNVGELKAEGEQVIGQTAGQITVDLAEVTFIDSSGIGGLLFLNNQLDESRRPVRLTGVTPEVLSVLELTRVHRVFEIEAAG
jgi:anti-sigma B factor antagonist